MTTLYEAAGGSAVLLALASAFHTRCLADPELNHPFSHADLNPEHVPRLAAYWGEVLGGPDDFSRLGVDQSSMQRLHAGHGDMSDLGRRFVSCFVAALDDAGVPDDPRLRTALEGYIRWAVDDVLVWSDAMPPEGLPMPHWSWEGLVVSG